MIQPSVAIVILNYNGKNYLEKFLPSVIASTYLNKKIIVADNASTDNSVQFLKEYYPQVEVMVNEKNLGFAGGYNWALQFIAADYYLLLNSDVEVTAGWIEPMVDLLEGNKNFGACQPKLLSYHHKQQFEYAGGSGGYIDSLGYPFSRGRIFDELETDNGQYNSEQLVFWASGAALLIRSNVFHKMEGFDASFFAHQEEIDLCWRMQLSGYCVFVCPTSVVYHVGAGTLPRGGRKVFLNFRNNLLMLCKNLPLKEKAWKLPFRFLLDAISAWKGLLGGDIYFFTAIFKAHLSVVLRVVTFQIVPSNKRVPLQSLQGVYANKIVWDHFILGKTKFSEIVEKKHA